MRRVEPPRALRRCLMEGHWNGDAPDLSPEAAIELDTYWARLEGFGLDLEAIIDGPQHFPPYCDQGQQREPCCNLYCPDNLVGEMHACRLPLLYQPVHVADLPYTCCRPLLGLKYDLQEIADLFGVSREMVRLVQVKALKKARKRCQARRLWRPARPWAPAWVPPPVGEVPGRG